MDVARLLGSLACGFDRRRFRSLDRFQAPFEALKDVIKNFALLGGALIGIAEGPKLASGVITTLERLALEKVSRFIPELSRALDAGNECVFRERT